MPNIAGVPNYVQPGVYSRVRSIRRSISIPGGLRVLAIMGLGQAEETVVLDAEGGGLDGVNPDFSGSDAPDGRHFILSKFPLVAKRTALTLDGIPLTGVEEAITTSAFDSQYDYRLEPATGRIELQRAHLVDQGGLYAPPGTSNVGNGSISTVSLLDIDAPTETWTIKATSVIRDAYGDPISEETTFSAIGSVSGQILDAYGSPIVFISDGITRDNGILQIAITEGATPFDRGDRFTVKVASKVLTVGQTLEANYIASADLNDPEFFVDSNALYQKHGFPSESNTLSLGASMAFENGAFGVMAVQTKPSIARRTSTVLLTANDPLTASTEGFPPVGNPVTSADVDAFQYPIASGTPDADTDVHIFVIDKTTGEETQISPTKVDFYNAVITADIYNDFINNAGYTFSYTVVEKSQVEDEGTDGEVTIGGSTFTADSASFSANNLDLGEVDTSKQIRILPTDLYGVDASDVAGTYDISAVGDGFGDDTVVTLSGANWASSHTDLRWELVDSADTSAYLLLTSDLYTSGTIARGDGLRATFIDADDADFYDTSWATAFEALEAVSCQIVVPLPTDTISIIQRAAIAHCELMSNTANQHERVALIGAISGITTEALVGRELVAVEDIGILEGVQGDDVEEVLAGNIEDLANYDVRVNFGDTFRAIYFWPDEIVRVINGTNTTIDGFYMAAAAGGLLAATANVSIPLTHKVLTGFSILRSKVRRPFTLNELGDRGISVVQPVTGGGQILHCKTTTSSGDPLEEEPSVVFIRDNTAQSLRDALSGFIGQPQDPTLTASITSVVVKVLQSLTAKGYLAAYRNINVVRDEVDPRQINVSVEVEPILPLDWIYVDISVGIL
ncbi:MAG: hypothetical protein WC523_00580 [Patescibacteria group bacterium]